MSLADQARPPTDFPVNASEEELHGMMGCDEIFADLDRHPLLPTGGPPFPSPRSANEPGWKGPLVVGPHNHFV
eukprot:4462401-Heterocapsa_arctica.AAC.1